MAALLTVSFMLGAYDALRPRVNCVLPYSFISGLSLGRSALVPGTYVKFVCELVGQ